MQQNQRPPAYSKDRERFQGQSRGKGGGGDFFKLPDPVSVKYYKDDTKKILDPELLDKEARDNALSFKDLKSTQMRRFYDEIKAIERKIMTGKDTRACQANFERDRALIVMFKAKSVYAEKRKVAPRAFTQFMFNHVASIHELADFKAFVKVFEAVVAFHKFFAKDN